MKKTVSRTKKQETEAVPSAGLPSLTFTEDESNKLSEFLNHVYKKVSWKELSTQEVFDTQRMFAFMKSHLSKVEGYILDAVRLIDTKGK